MNKTAYQPIQKNATMRKVRLACVIMFFQALPVLSLQMDLDVHLGDTRVQQSIVLKAN